MRTQDQIDAEYYINRFIIRAMSFNQKSITFTNVEPKKVKVDTNTEEDDGHNQKKEYFLDEELEMDMEIHYVDLVFSWSKNENEITISWK